jgi:hypothetical protein
VPIFPDFLRRLVALIHSMRLSLMKGAHADLSSTAWQEMGVKPGFACPGVPWGLSGISALDVATSRLPRSPTRRKICTGAPGTVKCSAQWREPPHSCGGARLSSRAAQVELISSGFSRGDRPTQRPMLISRFFWCMNWTTTLAVCSVSHCSLVMG